MLPITTRGLSSARRPACGDISNTGHASAAWHASLSRSALITALALANWSVQSAELGALRVLSASGDPLRAEIAISGATPEEADTLEVKLAPPEVYRQSQVEYSPALQGLQLTIQDRANGNKVVQIVSPGPLDARVLDLLVDVSWRMGRYIRQYSFVLAPAPAEARAPVVAASNLPPVAVGAGDTLMSIARSVQPPGATVYQTLLALFNANPQSFIDGNMNLLLAGSTLTIPGAQTVLAENDVAARRALSSQTDAFTLYRERLAQAAAGATPIEPGAVPAATSSGSITPAEPVPAPALATGDELKLSSTGTLAADSDAQAARDRIEEERTATEKAIQESESRVRELQENIASMRGLLESQNQALAAMEQRAGEPLAQAAPVPQIDADKIEPVAAAGQAAEAQADAQAPATPPVPTDDAAGWAGSYGLAIAGALAAVLAALLALLLIRRRGREEQGFRVDEPEAESVAPVAVAAPAVGPAPVAPAVDPHAPLHSRSEVNESDDGDDDEPLNPAQVPPSAPIDFGFDLDLDKPPSDEPPPPPPKAAPSAPGAAVAPAGAVAGLAAAMAASSGRNKNPPPAARAATPNAEPVVAPAAPVLIPSIETPLSDQPAGVKPGEPVVTPPAAPPVLPEPVSGKGLELDTDIGAAPELSTKLDLARAYIDIGDRVGARELLNDVVQSGNTEQRHRARDLLATL